MRIVTCLFALMVFFYIPTASAYIGPGVGAGTIAIVLGILSSVVLAFVGIIWYPVKRVVKRIRNRGRM